jgi:hypothetical protein
LLQRRRAAPDAAADGDGDELDLRCRWMFPLLYFVVLPGLLVTVNVLRDAV